MNREEAKKLFPIIQAFAEGKRIEFFNPRTNEWTVALNPNFYSEMIEWRVKPEPKEIWVNEYVGEGGYAYLSENEAKQEASSSATRVAVLYREVVGERE